MPRKSNRARYNSRPEDEGSKSQPKDSRNMPSPNIAIMDIPERPPPLEFITLTERPASQKKDFSHVVRSHAMQAVVHERRNPKSKKAASISNHPAEAVIKTSKELSGRFKLNSWAKKKRRRKNIQAQGTEKHVSGNTGIDTATLEQTTITNALQPYGALPISTSSNRTQQLLYHYNKGFIVNAFAINYDDTWKPFSTTDSALLNATLCLVAQHEDLLRGAEDSSENLFHKGEVMRIMNSRLLNDFHQVTDADITSVALLVILETINGSFEAATAHKIGLSKMVNFYGGIWNLEQNPVVIRCLSWSDIAYSTRFGTPPEYPCLSSALDISSEVFLEDISLFPLNDRESQILQTLRQISHTVSLPNITPYQKYATTSTVTNTEYLILSSITPLIAHTSPGSTLSQAFMLGSLLYLHLTFRLLPSFPNPSKLHLRLVSTLLSLLSSLSPHEFISQESLDLLLWIVFVCSAASGSGYPQIQHRKSGVGIEEVTAQVEDFVILMRTMDPSVLGQSKDEVRQRLKRVVWRDGICDVLHDSIWRVVVELSMTGHGNLSAF